MLIGEHQMGRRAGFIDYHYQNHYIKSKKTGRQKLTERSKAAGQQTQLRYTTDV